MRLARAVSPGASETVGLAKPGSIPSDTVSSGAPALRWTVAQPPVKFSDPKLVRLLDTRPKVLLVTAHRRESWGVGMTNIGAALADISELEPNLLIVVALHPNPGVRRSLVPVLEHRTNVILTEPLPYAEFAQLLNLSDIVLTDSGGIQEEAPSLGKPVLVMRNTTERPEAIAAGTARLVGTDRDIIVSSVRQLLHEPITYEAMATAVNPYGVGFASARTIDAFRHFFGDNVVIQEFDPTSPSNRDDPRRSDNSPKRI